MTEQESQQTEDVTQEQDVNDSYQSMQQRLNEANETIATLLQQLQLTIQTTGQCLQYCFSSPALYSLVVY